MSTTVTHDIRVTVHSRFEPVHSDPKAGRFLFSYRIKITNSGRDTVQLQRRHWIIRDSLAPTREVEGAGVVGETPILRPGGSFTYTSACDLKSGFGRMDGSFRMVFTRDDRPFDVVIPEMHLHFPHSCN